MENQQKIEAPTEADVDTIARALLHAQRVTTEVLGAERERTRNRSETASYGLPLTPARIPNTHRS